ncbi:hypothetical protein [Streptomyces bluensis]|uniref:hypothetical protein n=1 Tax=Streptomyces bluensis TaxID=33897 RepID=UPI003332C2AB
MPGARQLAARARRRVAKAKQSTPQASKAERERVLMVFRAAYEAGDLAGLVRCPDRVDFAEAGGELALVCHREGRVHSVDTVQITDGLITAYRRVLNPDTLVRV